jgi:transposase-like protein
MRQVTLLTGPRRRRRWRDDDRRRILAAALLPGAVIAEVVRQYEFSTGVSCTWRQRAKGRVEFEHSPPDDPLDDDAAGSEPFILGPIPAAHRNA